MEIQLAKILQEFKLGNQKKRTFYQVKMKTPICLKAFIFRTDENFVLKSKTSERGFVGKSGMVNFLAGLIEMIF